jgi:hypothetical protein
VSALGVVEEVLARVVACVVAATRAMRVPGIAGPLAVWALLRGALAMWLGTFPSPPWNAASGLWRLAGGEGALHFPEAYAALPRVLGWLDPLVEMAIGVPMLVLALRALPRAIDPQRTPPASGLPWRAAWLAAAPAVLGAGTLLAFSDRLGQMASGGDVMRGTAIVAALSLRALLVYALAAVVLGGCSAREAIRRSVTLSSSGLGQALSFVIVGFLFTIPWRFDPTYLASTFWSVMPEWMAPWAAIGSVVAVVAHWITQGAAARWYLHVHGEESA